MGGRSEVFTATELPDEEKVPILRAYLKRWKAEVGVFFEGVDADATDEAIRAIAPRHPAFRLTEQPADAGPGAAASPGPSSA